MKRYPAVICEPCGLKHGRRECREATFYPGVCGLCGKHVTVTEPRDYGHLKAGWAVKGAVDAK